MNKLLLVEDINELENENYISFDKATTLNIRGKTTLYNVDSKNSDLIVNLNDNTILNFDKINYTQQDVTLDFNLKNNSELTLNLLIINEGENKVILNVNMTGNESKALIKVHTLNKNSHSKIHLFCNGYIKENTHDNELLEDLKGLIQTEDEIIISPNMYVKTNEVLANHKVTISSFNPEELFYLNTKGLSTNAAQELILKSFTHRLISDVLHDKINWR